MHQSEAFHRIRQKEPKNFDKFISIQLQIPKQFYMKVVILQQESTKTQSIGKNDVNLFNTELAMHYRVIFKYGCFLSRARLCYHVLDHISHDKSKREPKKLLFS